MAITHVASAAGATTNPDLTDSITLSADIQTDDILLVCATNRYADVGVTISISDNDTGGNAWARRTGGTGQAVLWWKRATSGTASKVVTVTVSESASLVAGYSAYRGAYAGGDPITDLTFETNASANETHAEITPSNDDSWVFLYVANVGNDNAVSTQATATSPGALAERFDKLSTAAQDCGGALASAEQAGTATATGAFTWAQTNGATESAVWALRPAVAGGTPGIVTPGAIARSAAVNAVTVKGSAVTEPAAVARSATLPASTPAGKAATNPAVTARSVVIPQADAFDSGSIGSTAPDPITRPFLVNAATPAGPAVAEPAATARSLLPNAPTVAGPAETSPSAISRSFSVNAVGVKGAAVTTPAATARSFTVDAVTVDAGGTAATTQPSTIARTFTLPAPIAKGLGKVLPAVISLAAAIHHALGNLIHGPNPGTAPLGSSGVGTAPSPFQALGAALGTSGMSNAEPNTGRSTAPGSSGGSEA